MQGHWPVVSYVEGVEALGEALHVVRTDLLQEVDVVLRVEAAHVVLRRLVRLEHLHRELCSSAPGVSEVTGLNRLIIPSSSCTGHNAAPDCVWETAGEASSGARHLQDKSQIT